MPLREESNWTERYISEIEVEPLRKFYLIFEGARTEVSYFRGLINFSKEIGISNNVEIVILNKEGAIKHHSGPEQICKFLKEKKKEKIVNGEYVEGVDSFIMVFDRDSYKDDPQKYNKFIDGITDDVALTVTSPCFELWLTLHKEGVVDNLINPNYEAIFNNAKVSNQHTVMSKIFSDEFGLNPKKKMNFCIFLSSIEIAIENEKLLEQDYKKMDKKIGSNVGVLIEKLREDPRKWINTDEVS